MNGESFYERSFMKEKKHVVVTHVSDYAFVAKGTSNHYVVIDSLYQDKPAASAGPMELVLMALGGCSGSDVVEILRKKRQLIEDFRIEITGTRVEDHPRVFETIHMKYVFVGPSIERKAVERAIELSLTKYCSVHGMLSRVVPITHDYEIVGQVRN
jgi:putative redox protein